jgi:hypothetical protein
MQWFLNLLEELGIERLVGHPAEIQAAELRKQKHDRRDANLILKLLMENRFPTIWWPSKRATGSAVFVAAPSSVGSHADANTECVAVDSLGEWPRARPLPVES